MIARLASVICVALLSATPCAAAGLKVLDRIAGPDGGWDYVRIDHAHDRLLVAHGAAVMSVDLKTKAVKPDFASGKRLHDVLPIKGDSQIVVTDGGAGTTTFLDAAGGAPIATVAAGRTPDAAAFDPRSGLVLVMDHAGGAVVLIDPDAHAAVATVPVGERLEAAAVDAAGHAFVNEEESSEVAVLDVARRQVTARYKLHGCEGPTGIAYDAAGRLLIVACDGATAILDAASGKTLATLPTGKGADGVAFDAARRLAFVPAGADGRLSVIAVRRTGAKIVQTLKTELGARTLAYDPETRRIFLPVAERGAPPPGGGRATFKPGTFHILVVGS